MNITEVDYCPLTGERAEYTPTLAELADALRRRSLQRVRELAEMVREWERKAGNPISEAL